MRWVSQAWLRDHSGGELVLAIHEQQVRDAPDIAALAAAHASIRLRPLRPLGGGSLLASGWAVRDSLRTVVAEHEPDNVLALYLDHTQLALATRVPLTPGTSLSGVLFRPELHYDALGSREPTARGRLRRARKAALLRAALRHPQFSTLFSLDPMAVPALRHLSPRVRIEPLPDPAHVDAPREAPASVRHRFGVEPGRRLALLFGHLSARKGVLQLLDALPHVGAESAGGLAILLAGRVDPAMREALDARLHALRRTTLTQVLVHDAFLAHDEIQSVVAAADLGLVPYQRHIGSSGVLMRAAAAGVPVLAQDWGLMGHQVRRHRLGQAVDTSDPGAIAEALARFTAEPAAGFDHAEASRFASSHTVEAFTSALLRVVAPSA